MFHVKDSSYFKLQAFLLYTLLNLNIFKQSNSDIYLNENVILLMMNLAKLHTLILLVVYSILLHLYTIITSAGPYFPLICLNSLSKSVFLRLKVVYKNNASINHSLDAVVYRSCVNRHGCCIVFV